MAGLFPAGGRGTYPVRVPLQDAASYMYITETRLLPQYQNQEPGLERMSKGMIQPWYWQPQNIKHRMKPHQHTTQSIRANRAKLLDGIRKPTNDKMRMYSTGDWVHGFERVD